jgi:hypothetical protein
MIVVTAREAAKHYIAIRGDASLRPLQGRLALFDLWTGGVGLRPQPPANLWHPCRDALGGVEFVVLPSAAAR